MKQTTKVNLQITAIADLVVVFSILFFMTQTLDAFNFSKQMVFSTGIFSLVVAICVYGKTFLDLTSNRMVTISILVIIVCTVLLAIPNDLFGGLTLWGEFSRANGLMSRIPLLLLILIYAVFGSTESTNRFFKWAMALLVLEIVYGFIQLSGLDPVPWVNPYNNIFVTTGNPNFAAALFAVLVTLNLRFLLSDQSLTSRLLAAAVVLLGLYMAWATRSIQGVLTILAAVFLLCLIYTFRRFHQLRIRATVLATLFCLGIPVIGGLLNIGPLRTFLFQETLAIRLHYWRVALSMIRDNPLFGVGIDRYGDFYRFYREPDFVEKYGPNLISTNAHNVALQWGSDIGVSGIACYLFLFAVITGFYLRNADFSAHKNLSKLDVLYVSFFAFYLQSLFSIAQLSITILGFSVAGVLIGEVKSSRFARLGIEPIESLRSWGKKTSFVGLGTWWIVSIIVLLPFTSYYVRADVQLRQAIQLPGLSQGEQDLSNRSSAIRESVTPFLADQDYVSLAIQNLFSQGDSRVGIEIAKDAYKVNSRSWASLQSQALAYAQSNILTEAVQVTNKALKIDPNNYNLKANLADLHFKLGNFPEARMYAEMTLKIAPSSTDAYGLAQSVLEQLG